MHMVSKMQINLQFCSLFDLSKAFHQEAAHVTYVNTEDKVYFLSIFPA